MKSLNINSSLVTSVFLVLIALSLAGCEKMIDVDTPVDQLISANIFSDSVTAKAAVNGMYSMMYNGTGTADGLYKFRITTLPARLSDELVPQTTSLDDFYSNSLNAANADVTSFWADSYNTIYLANSIIDGLQSSGNSTDATKKQLTAEAKFIRAFSHFYLVNYFGKVPYILTSNVTTSNVAPASAVDAVYTRIIQDLKDARDALPTDYSVSGGNRTQVNSLAASAMLARVYLYTGQWALAEAEASRVINKKDLYDMVKDPNNVFLANSREAIWQFYVNVYGYTYFAMYNVPAGNLSIPSYGISDKLYNNFEANDARKTKWIGTVVVNGTPYRYPSKYKSITDSNTEYETPLRLGEQYLIRAEARANQNKITEARADLDTIRTRAGLPPTTAGNLSSVLLAIEQERKVELFCEWGHRWLDLKRTGRANAVLGAEKPGGWQVTDVLLPLPQSALDTNPLLTQNSGYN